MRVIDPLGGRVGENIISDGNFLERACCFRVIRKFAVKWKRGGERFHIDRPEGWNGGAHSG